MRSLYYTAPGTLEWRDVRAPALGDDRAALVRPVAASTCDLDEQIVRGRTPIPPPFALGHECVAEVIDVGDAVTRVRPGQRVAIPWHINCGECRRCAAGHPAACEAVPFAAGYGVPVGGEWGGLFDDVVLVPFADAMLFPLSPSTSLGAVVSASDNLTLGLEVLRGHLRDHPDGRVLILGARSTGLYAIDVARALGAGEVVYTDSKHQRLELAGTLGARAVSGPPTEALGEFDVVLDARLNGDWLRAGLSRLAPEGACEVVGPYFQEEPLPLFEMYIRGARIRISRGNPGAHISEVLKLVGDGALRPERVITHTFAWEDAPEALLEAPLKPLFLRAEAEPAGDAP